MVGRAFDGYLLGVAVKNVYYDVWWRSDNNLVLRLYTVRSTICYTIYRVLMSVVSFEQSVNVSVDVNEHLLKGKPNPNIPLEPVSRTEVFVLLIAAK